MNSNDPIRKIVAGLFVLIAIGLIIFKGLYFDSGPKASPGSQPIIGSVPIPAGSTVTDVATATNHGKPDFDAIQISMAFAQLKDVFRIVSISNPAMEQSVEKGSQVLRFMNPDGSSIEVLMWNGKVIAKEQFDAETTRQRFPKV